MSAPNDGGPAFPCEVPAGVIGSGCGPYVEWGMSMRDYFAAKAMLLIGPLLASGDNEKSLPQSARGMLRSKWIAEQCYHMADAMLAERNRETQP